MTKIEALELELAARKLVEGTELDWVEVLRTTHTKMCVSHTLPGAAADYELALGVIEGKPVWGDSDLCNQYGFTSFARNVPPHDLYLWSWNQPKPQIPEGFTPWSGGECPVSRNTEVDVIYADGVFVLDSAINIRWSYFAGARNVIAYRVIKPKTVMVELPVKHVEYWDSQGEFLRSALEPKPLDVKSMTFYAACHKALEGMK